MSLEDNPLYALIKAQQKDRQAEAESAFDTQRQLTNAVEGRTGRDEFEQSGLFYSGANAQAQELRTDKSYDEAVDADFNLGTIDMPTGINIGAPFGADLALDNRKYSIDRMKSITSLAMTIDSLKDNAVLEDFYSSARDEFSDSGWIQMGRGIAAIFDPFNAYSDDYTGDAKAKLGELRDFMQDQELTDKDGKVIPYTNKDFLESVRRSNPEAAIMLDRYGITEKSLEGVTNFGNAVEALSMKLFQQGQMERSAEAHSRLTGAEKAMAFAENLGNMIGQDPDMAAEIGIEAGGLVLTAVVSGGTAVPAYLGWRMAARGGRLAMIGKKAISADRARRRLEKMQRFAEKAERFKEGFSTAMNFKPSLSFGGNVAEYYARRKGLGAWSQNVAYLSGQMVDGFVGGAGARLSSNMVLQEEAMMLYGNQQGINLTRNMWVEGAMGAGFSTILGSTFKFVPRGIAKAFDSNKKFWYTDFEGAKQVEVRSEEERLQKLYADPDTRPAGVSSWQAQRQMAQDATLELSLATGRKVGRGEGYDLLAGLGNIPQDAGLQAIVRATRDAEQGTMNMDNVRQNILEDQQFLDEVALYNDKLTADVIARNAQLELAKLRKNAADEGRDLDYEAAKMDGLSDADAIKAAKETKIARAKARAEEAAADAKRAQDNLDTDAGTGERQRKRAEKMERRDAKRTKEEDAELKKRRDEIEDAEGDVEANNAARKSDAEADKAQARADEEAKKAAEAQAKADAAEADAKAKAQAEADAAKAKAEAEAAKATEAKAKAEKDAQTALDKRKPLSPELEADLAAKRAELEAKDAEFQKRREQSAKNIEEAKKDAARKNREQLKAEAEQKRKNAERKAKEAEEYEKKVREATDAGPVDEYEFSDIRARKQTQADTLLKELESDIAAIKNPDGTVNKGDLIRALQRQRWDSDPEIFDQIIKDLDAGPENVDPADTVAKVREALKDSVEEVTDADIKRDLQLSQDDLGTRMDIILEAQKEAAAAKNKVMLSKADGQIIDDPSKFRAPRLRTDGEARNATVAARSDAESSSAATEPLKAQLREAEAELSKLRSEQAADDVKADVTVTRPTDEAVLALKQQRAEKLDATKKKDDLYASAKSLRKRIKDSGQDAPETKVPLSKMNKQQLAEYVAEIEIEVGLARRRAEKGAPKKPLHADRIAELEAKARVARQELHNRGVYDRKADLRAAREAEVKLKKLMDRGSHGNSEGAASSGTGTISYDALQSIFEDSLRDIDLEFVFGEAIVKGKSTSDMAFNMQQVMTILQARIDAVDGLKVDPDAALTPQQIRLRQAKELADWRATQAKRQAEAYEIDNGTAFRGTMDNGARIQFADQYELRVMQELHKILSRRKLKMFSGNNKKHMRTPNTLLAFVNDEVVSRFDSPEARLANLGDGTLDHVHPTVAARAIADIFEGLPDGTKMNKAEVQVPNDATGVMEVRTAQTRNVNTISAVQPAQDREIANILARMEYDYRIEAIAKHNFNDPSSVTLDEMLDYIEGARMIQDQGRALNAEELTLRARWVPPQLRTDIDGKPESIREKIDRVTEEMLEMDAAAYDLIHDDFGTRRGDWGISKQEANDHWGKAHSLAGGFPVASAMPNPDGGYSFGMAVLDTHAVNNPGTMAHTVAALKRGQDNMDRMMELEAKQAAGQALTDAEAGELRALQEDRTQRNVDGSQNGVRHAHAIAMMSRDQGSTDQLFADVLQALNTLDPEARAKLLRDHPEIGTAEKGKDFYVALAVATNKKMADLGKDGNKLAQWVAANISFERADAKKPVMILPYGAGMKAIKGSAKSVLNDKANVELRASLKEAGFTEAQIVDFIAEQWYGSKQKGIDSLINAALELPDSDVMMASIMRDRAGADPFKQMAKELKRSDWDSLDEDTQVSLMIDEATERARVATGMAEPPAAAIDTQFSALQIEARARAMTRAGDMPADQALRVAREQWAEEITLVQTGTKEEIVDAVKAGRLSFFDRTIKTLNRVEYYRATDAQAEATARQTGQGGVGFDRTMPAEAQGVFYAEQLMDWRTRMVTPTMAEADLKGRKSRRGMLDIHGVLEEGETVVYRTSEAEAKADFDEKVHTGKMTEDEWFAKHIDDEKTIGSGVVTFKEHRGSLRQRLSNKAKALKEDALRHEEARLGIKADEGASIASRRKAVLDGYIEAERTRIKQLAVKSSLAELASDFSPPLTKDSAGKTAQLPRLTEAQKMDRWQAQTDDVHASAGEARRIYEGLDDKGKKAYRKSYGELYEPHRGPDGEDKLEEIVAASNKRHGALKEGEHEPQVAKTMGGMLGSRAIHPTEALDVKLGVPALREAAQRRTMGQYGQGKAVKAKAEAQTRQVDALERISEGGELFARNERHRVTHTDADQLANVRLEDSDIFDADIAARYGEDAANDMILTALSRYADEFGLEADVEAGNWGKIVAHRMWTKNLKEISSEYQELAKMRQLEGETLEAYNTRYEEAEAALMKKWQERAAEDMQTWEDATNKEWDSHEIDPFGNIKEVTAFDAEGKALTRRQAIVRSAQMDGEGNAISSDPAKARQRAGLKTNIDVIDGESIDGLRYADGTVMPDPIRNRRGGKSDLLPFEDGTEKATPRQGFSRAMIEQDGQRVDMDQLDDNAILKVHYVHAKDRASATGAVGAHMGESRLAGLHQMGEPLTVAEAKRLIAEGKIDGSDANVRFFTADGIEVVNGHMVGHNLRRSATRNEAHHILMNSSNRYLGDRLAMSGLTGKSVRSQRSVASRMDDRLTRNRHETTAMVGEQRMIINFLGKNDPDAIDKSSFLGGILDIGRYWNDPDFRADLFRSHLAKTERKALSMLGEDISRVKNPLRSNERSFLRDLTTERTRFEEGETGFKLSKDERLDLFIHKDEVEARLLGKYKKMESVPEDLKSWYDSIDEGVTLRDIQTEGQRLKKLDEEFNPNRYDPRTDENLGIDTKVSGLIDAEIKLAEELAGLHLILGESATGTMSASTIRTLLGSGWQSRLGAAGTNIDRVRVLANNFVEHNRALRKLQETALSEGITGLGMTPTVLRIIGDGTLVIDSIDDIKALSDDELLKVRNEWLDTEHGGDKRDDSRLKLSPGDRKQVEAALVEALDITKDSPLDPFSDRMGPDAYRGPFVDAGGTPRDAKYFMEGDKFSALSDGHREMNEFLENLLDSGTLKLPEVRMLRATLAQMDGDLLKGLKLSEVANIDDFAASLGLEPSASRARGVSYNTKGQIGLALYKNRIGRDLNAVDVILHEVGHIAQARLIAENSPELMAVRSMADNPEGKKTLRKLVMAMHGGKWTQDAAKQYKYFTSDPDEFIAAWFSYSLMARTLSDKVTIEAAYREAGGIGAALRNAMRKMASYAYTRLGQFARAFQTADKAYSQQMNRVMNTMLGKADVPVIDKPTEFAKYHADGVDKVEALQKAREEVAALEMMGLDDADPSMIEARDMVRDLEEDVLRNARASDFDGSARAKTLQELMEARVVDEFTEVDGTVNFGRMVDEDPDMATHWLVNHVLPHFQEGRYAGIDNIGLDVAKRRRLTKEGKHSLAKHMDNLILSPARARDVVNSQVQLRLGDKTYSIMQLLAEMMDSGTIMSTGRLNGRDMMTLHGIAKGLESQVIRPIAILDDTLRVEVAKEQGSVTARVSRSLAQGNGAVAQRQQELRRLAGELLLPKDTANYRKAKAEVDKLPDTLKPIVLEMSDSFAQSSQKIKRDAVFAKLIGQARSDNSGLMPIRIRPEHMTNKANEFGPALTDTYGSNMIRMSRNVGTYDIDSLIGAGILPPPDSVNSPSRLADELLLRANDKLIDPEELARLRQSGELDKLFDDMQHARKGRAGTFKSKKLFTVEGTKRYEGSVLNGDHTADGSKYMVRRFRQAVTSTESASRKAYYQDANTSGANLRAVHLGRRAGSTSYYFGGDDFLSLTQLVDNHGDFFEFDVRVGASALVRGVGLEAADSANMSRAFGGGVQGLSFKKLMDWLEQDVARNGDAETIQSVSNGMAHLRRGYERLSGGLPTVDQTGGMVSDALARGATDLAMLSYGGNLGVAMFAETAATVVNDVLPRAIVSPVKTAGMLWKSVTEGMSPVRKTQFARQVLFGMHIAKDTVGIRSFTRDGIDDMNPLDNRNGWERGLRALGSATSKLSLAPTVQSFNKGFAVAGAMDDLLTNIEPARKLRQLLDARGGVDNQKQFKELAKQAGFGRNWPLALRMQDAGLLDSAALDTLAKQATDQNSFQTRVFDMDVMSGNATRSFNRGSPSEGRAVEELVGGLRMFMEEAIARNNVEPRVLDMKLVDNSGWNKIQDVFLSWPRAFYAQKSVLRGGGTYQGGMTHILGFYAAQTMWDAMYTSIQGFARGDDVDEMLHEVESDPVGWYMQKAARMPLFGGWSLAAEAALGFARNEAAEMGFDDSIGFGYHKRAKGAMDFGSSPAMGALNSLWTTASSTTQYVAGLAKGTNSLSMEDRQLQSVLRSYGKVLPGFNNLLSRAALEMWKPSQKNNELRDRSYYEVMQLKRQLEVERKRLQASLR
jgi:hypothetical protein